MFVFKSGKWRWHFRERAVAEEMALAPEERMSRAEEIRNTGGERIVYAGPGYFYKLESPRLRGAARLKERLFPRAKGEFDSLLRLGKMGIPAVSPVAYGVSGTDSVLITRAAEHTVTIVDYLDRYIDRGELPPQVFFDTWSDLLFRLIASRLYIPDFHGGNLLYDEERNALTIVDPPGMTRMLLPRPDRVLRMLKRQFASSIEYLPERVFIEMIARHRPDPERLFWRLIEYNADYVRCSQLRNGKRLKDFRRGKFTAAADGFEFARRGEGRFFTLENTETLELPEAAALAMWEREFVLGLYGLPRLRIVGRKPGAGVLFRQRAGDAPVDAARREPLVRRLRIAGFDPAEFDFAADLFGRTVLRDMKFLR